MIDLIARGLAVAYDGETIFSAVDCTLRAGDRVALVGPNGSGKSSLLRVLAGLQAPAAGYLQPRAGLRIHYLPQGRGLDPADVRSGGEQTRAALRDLLSRSPGLLLLDEPGAHLDWDATAWLERSLRSYPGTALLISHDRWFMDRAVQRVLALEGGALREYPGNYTAYAAARAAERRRQAVEYAAYVKERRHLEEQIRLHMSWAARGDAAPGPGAKNAGAFQGFYQRAADRNARQAQSYRQRLAHLGQVESPRRERRLHIQVDTAGRTGRLLLEARGLGHGYAGRWLLRGADLYLERGDRVAVVGPNGSGKSTLLRLLLGQEAPREGSVRRPPGARFVHLAQAAADLDPAATVLATALADARLEPSAVRTLLGCLLFRGDQVHQPTGTLSGGERLRLALARLLAGAPDVIMLDEPTASLDLPSCEALETALAGYPGALVVVSHDQYLLERLTTRVVAVGGGRLEQYPGSLAEYRAARAGSGAAADPAAAAGAAERAAMRVMLEARLAQLGAQLDEAARRGDRERLAALEADYAEARRHLAALRG